MNFASENRLPASNDSDIIPKLKCCSWMYEYGHFQWLWCISEMFKWKYSSPLRARSRKGKRGRNKTRVANQVLASSEPQTLLPFRMSLSSQYSAMWKANLRRLATCILFVGCSSSGEIYAPSQTSLSSPVYANAFEIWGHPGQIRHSTSPVTFRIQCETRYGWEVHLAKPNLWFWCSWGNLFLHFPPARCAWREAANLSATGIRGARCCSAPILRDTPYGRSPHTHACSPLLSILSLPCA
jgi:hypothetical protein